MSQTVDELYEEVKAYVIETNKCNPSHIKDNFGLGFLLTERLIKRLEVDGIVSQSDDMKSERYVLKQLSLFS